MICKKCGSECPDGNIFCEKCGAELDAPVLPENIDDKGRVKKTKVKKEKKPVPEKTEGKKIRSPEEKARFVKKLKAGAVCLGVVAAAVGIVMLINMIGSNKGYALAQKIPIGRNVPYAETETGVTFDTKCSNGMINSMAEFDYIRISEDTVKINGSEQPEWVIMLTVEGEDKIITSVEYYDFTQLKLNWKGRKMAEPLSRDSLEFGMSIRNVNKTLGMKPYYIRRTVSNDSTYCYRYFYTDPEEGFDRAFNYFVSFSDVDLSVKNVTCAEINYARTLLSAQFPEETKADTDIVEQPADDDAQDTDNTEDDGWDNE